MLFLRLFGRWRGALLAVVGIGLYTLLVEAQASVVRAAMLYSTAYALRQGMSAPIPPVDRAAYDSAVAACRAQLGETAFAEVQAHAAVKLFQEVVEENLKPG